MAEIFISYVEEEGVAAEIARCLEVCRLLHLGFGTVTEVAVAPDGAVRSSTIRRHPPWRLWLSG